MSSFDAATKIAHPQLHGVGVRNFYDFPDLLISTYHIGMRMLYAKRTPEFRNPEWFRPIYLVILFTHLALAGSDCSDGVGHFESCDQRAVRTPQADRALRPWPLWHVCLRDRRG